ncbi:MAG TPA: hypothetical protein VNF91_11125 [Candidatus Acidoferrum sp.]|nr:hypothetical protein [Candidatus Acidoferrum sp.]
MTTIVRGAEYQRESLAYAMGSHEHRAALTDEQLQRLAHIAARIEAISDELYGFEVEAEQWAGTDCEAADWGELCLEREAIELARSISSGSWDEIRNAVRDLRVTRGLVGFGDWWEHRVRRLHGRAGFEQYLWENLGQEDDRELSELPDSEVPRRPRFIAVDEAMRAADPVLVRILDEVAALPGPTIDKVRALPAHHVTEEHLQDRAEAALIKLIDSGWRP